MNFLLVLLLLPSKENFPSKVLPSKEILPSKEDQEKLPSKEQEKDF